MISYYLELVDVSLPVVAKIAVLFRLLSQKCCLLCYSEYFSDKIKFSIKANDLEELTIIEKAYSVLGWNGQDTLRNLSKHKCKVLPQNVFNYKGNYIVENVFKCKIQTRQMYLIIIKDIL